jgi:hypothetical protein
MSKKHKKKKALSEVTKPTFIEVHWEKIIIIILFVIPLLYFASFLNVDRMIAGSDYLLERYVLEKWSREQLEKPLWYPHVFGGISALGTPVGLHLFLFERLRQVIEPHIVLVLKFITIFFLAGLGMYLYLKEIGLSKYAAAVGAVIYQFIGNLASTPQAGLAARATSIALFPLLLLFIHRGIKSKRLLYFVLFSLISACSFYEGQFQLTYYGLLFIVGYVIYHLVIYRKDNSTRDVVKIIGYGFGSVILVCLFMAAVWLPVLGGLGIAARGIERGYEWATSWALPPNELIDLCIPTYSGILDNYWGFNHFKIHLEYFGLLALTFAIFAIIFYWRKPYVKFYTLKIIVILLVALGSATPFFWFFYTIIPGFKLFRAPALVFYLVSFGFIVLGMIAFDQIFIKTHGKKEDAISKRKFLVAGGILLGIFVLIGLICMIGKDSIIQSMRESLGPKFVSDWNQQIAQVKLSKISENFPAFINGIFRSVAFLTFILIVIYASIKQQIKVWIFAFVAMTITLVDQLPLVAKYLPSGKSPKAYYAADDVMKSIKRDPGVFRVFPSPWYEHTTDLHLMYHGIQSAGGYIANPIQRYQNFIGAGTSVMFRPGNLIQYPKFLNMLNIKYIVAPSLPEDISRYDVKTQRTIEQIKQYLSRFSLAFRGQKFSVYLNDSLLPRAYLVPQYRVVAESEVLNVLKSPQFNPRKIVILEEDPQIALSSEEASLVTAKIENYSANEIVCSTNSSFSGFLVLTDNWHPDWKVFVDGKKQKLYRANYIFRAVYVPAGKHEIVFKYISSYFNIGSVISIIAFILAIGFCVVAKKGDRLLFSNT